MVYGRETEYLNSISSPRLLLALNYILDIANPIERRRITLLKIRSIELVGDRAKTGRALCSPVVGRKSFPASEDRHRRRTGGRFSADTRADAQRKIPASRILHHRNATRTEYARIRLGDIAFRHERMDLNR